MKHYNCAPPKLRLVDLDAPVTSSNLLLGDLRALGQCFDTTVEAVQFG